MQHSRRRRPSGHLIRGAIVVSLQEWAQLAETHFVDHFFACEWCCAAFAFGSGAGEGAMCGLGRELLTERHTMDRLAESQPRYDVPLWSHGQFFMVLPLVTFHDPAIRRVYDGGPAPMLDGFEGGF